MEKEKIRKEIALDLKGKPSRNPLSLVPDLLKKLRVESGVITHEINQMKDLGHILPVDESSIRLSEIGEEYYFSTNNQKIWKSIKSNWPHITSNLIALGAFIAAILAYLKK